MIKNRVENNLVININNLKQEQVQEEQIYLNLI
jgi:hypothetical protein